MIIKIINTNNQYYLNMLYKLYNRVLIEKPTIYHQNEALLCSENVKIKELQTLQTFLYVCCIVFF